MIVNKVGEMDEGRSRGSVGVDGVRVRSLDLILIGKPNLLFLGEFDEGVCSDELRGSLPTSGSFRIQRGV